jgi:hypothetical protein
MLQLYLPGCCLKLMVSSQDREHSCRYNRIHVVESFKGLEIRAPNVRDRKLQSAWPLAVLLEPRVFVHERNDDSEAAAAETPESLS